MLQMCIKCAKVVSQIATFFYISENYGQITLKEAIDSFIWMQLNLWMWLFL